MTDASFEWIDDGMASITCSCGKRGICIDGINPTICSCGRKYMFKQINEIVEVGK